MKLWSSRGSEEMKDVERGVRGEEEEKGERENGNGRRMGEMGRETRWILEGVGRRRTKAKGKECKNNAGKKGGLFSHSET